MCSAGHGPPHGSRLAPYVMSSRVGQAWHKAQVGSQWRMCSLRGEEVLKPEGLSLALSPWAYYHLLPFPSPAGLSFIPRPGCPNRPDDWAFPVFQTHHATLQHSLWRIHCLSEKDGMVLLAEVIPHKAKKNNSFLGHKHPWKTILKYKLSIKYCTLLSIGCIWDLQPWCNAYCHQRNTANGVHLKRHLTSIKINQNGMKYRGMRQPVGLCKFASFFQGLKKGFELSDWLNYESTCKNMFSFLLLYTGANWLNGKYHVNN